MNDLGRVYSVMLHIHVKYHGLRPNTLWNKMTALPKAIYLALDL